MWSEECILRDIGVRRVWGWKKNNNCAFAGVRVEKKWKNWQVLRVHRGDAHAALCANYAARFTQLGLREHNFQKARRGKRKKKRNQRFFFTPQKRFSGLRHVQTRRASTATRFSALIFQLQTILETLMKPRRRNSQNWKPLRGKKSSQFSPF